MTIALVTGAHGFIGRYVARALAGNGFTVTGVGHGSWSEDTWRQWGIAKWHKSDISTESLWSLDVTPEIIVHCAGGSSVSLSAASPYEDFQRTVAAMAAVLEYVRVRAKDAAVVVPSSAAVYGHASRIPIAESDSTAPISPYGVHKHLAEQLCFAYARQFSLKLAIVRLFSVFGAGLRKQLLWDACTKLRDGDGRFFGTGNEIRDWIHVEDAVSLLLMAGRRASSDGVVVNGGTGIGTTVAQIVSRIKSGLGTKVDPVFDESRRRLDPAVYVADMTQAASWGWKPARSWEDGVDEYVSWFKSCGH